MVNKKPFKIIWDRNALDDLKEILSFLSKQSAQAPKIIKEGILTRLDTIKTKVMLYFKNPNLLTF